jgi:hypothetical protein
LKSIAKPLKRLIKQKTSEEISLSEVFFIGEDGLQKQVHQLKKAWKKACKFVFYFCFYLPLIFTKKNKKFENAQQKQA